MMTTETREVSHDTPALPNGSGAAAILSAGIGSFALAILAIAADKSAAIKSMLVFYKPTGPLSGETTGAILIWIVTWVVLDLLWSKKAIALTRTNRIAFVLMILSFLLTFPPIADLF
jgi:hypothetical protein